MRYGEIYTTYETWFDDCVSHTDESAISNPKYFEHGDILFAITGESVEDIAKSVAYVGHDKCLAGGDIVVLKHNQNPKYLAYALSTDNARRQKSKGKIKSKVVHSSVPAIEEIEIPLPSLDVQDRLVNVLDNFEEICNDLNIGLPAEIEARQKQYEYYRDLLLTFVETGDTILQKTEDRRQKTEDRRQKTEDRRQKTEDRRQKTEDRRQKTEDRQAEIALLQYVFGFATVKLDEVCRVESGGTPSKKEKKYWNDGTIKWLGSSVCQNKKGVDEVTDYITESGLQHSSAKIQHADTTLIAMVGATIGKVAYLTFDAATNQNVASLYPQNESLLYAPYLYYACTTLYEKFAELGKNGFAMASLGFIRGLEIIIPTVDEQKKIVAILDRFERLCEDISDGIPAEIEARQKQYEYYRDKLLDFKRKD